MAQLKWRWMRLKPGARWELISPVNCGVCPTAEACANIHKPRALLVSPGQDENAGTRAAVACPMARLPLPFHSLRGAWEGGRHTWYPRMPCVLHYFLLRAIWGELNISCGSLTYDGSRQDESAARIFYKSLSRSLFLALTHSLRLSFLSVRSLFSPHSNLIWDKS